MIKYLTIILFLVGCTGGTDHKKVEGPSPPSIRGEWPKKQVLDERFDKKLESYYFRYESLVDKVFIEVYLVDDKPGCHWKLLHPIKAASITDISETNMVSDLGEPCKLKCFRIFGRPTQKSLQTVRFIYVDNNGKVDRNFEFTIHVF